MALASAASCSRVEVEDRLGVGTVPELGVVAGDAVDERAELGERGELALQGHPVAVAAVEPGPGPDALAGDEAGAVRRGELDPRPPGIAEQHRVGVTGEGRRGPAHAVAVEAALGQVGHHDRPGVGPVEQRVGGPGIGARVGRPR